MNGLATGAGLQMALHSDVRLAHPGVRMAQPEINAGLPSVLGSWIMLISIGLSRTQELALSGKLIDAETCLKFGLVDFLVPEDLLLTDAKRIAASLGEKPPNAVRLTKQRTREVTRADWDATVEAGARMAREAFATGEPQRTAKAFLERRRERRRDFHADA